MFRFSTIKYYFSTTKYYFSTTKYYFSITNFLFSNSRLYFSNNKLYFSTDVRQISSLLTCMACHKKVSTLSILYTYTLLTSIYCQLTSSVYSVYFLVNIAFSFWIDRIDTWCQLTVNRRVKCILIQNRQNKHFFVSDYSFFVLNRQNRHLMYIDSK